MQAMIEGPTQALRERSPELLRTAMLRMLAEYATHQPAPDTRDLMWSLAPYHDCARRLALDPAAFFDAVADAGPPQFADVLREFGPRTDTEPEEFGGYALINTSAGPSYVWA